MKASEHNRSWWSRLRRAPVPRGLDVQSARASAGRWSAWGSRGAMIKPCPKRGLQVWAGLWLSGVLAVAGCAGSAPSRFYTLRALPGADGHGATTGGTLAIGLGPVTFPTFLDRPEIVSRGPDNRLALDEFNRWGGTLQNDFVRVWGENLAYLVGTSRILIFPTEVRFPLDVRITADVLNFEGTGSGEAVLKVRWAVLDPRLEQALVVRESSYRQALRPPADQGALISAMSAVLGAFSEEVAAAVRSLPKPPPAPPPLY